MRYTVRTSLVSVVGRIWMPAATCAMDYTLSAHDVENMRGEDGSITREDVADWISTHSGDFQSIADFSASIEDGEATLDFDWADPISESTYHDCMFGSEDA